MSTVKELFTKEILQACPQCNHLMYALKGSKLAICENCGYKESCCY